MSFISILMVFCSFFACGVFIGTLAGAVWSWHLRSGLPIKIERELWFKMRKRYYK